MGEEKARSAGERRGIEELLGLTLEEQSADCSEVVEVQVVSRLIR